MPKPETLSAYYSGYYSHSDNKFTFHDAERFAHHVFNLIGCSSKRTEFHILDFGGGDGTISVGLANLLLGTGIRSVQIELVDYQELPLPDRTGAIYIGYNRSLSEMQPARYDLVLASSIIEHLPEPRPELDRLFSALAAGGVLYARTPWMAPIFQLYERFGLPFDFTYPAHVHDLGKAFWENLSSHISSDSTYSLRQSQPSPVESALGQAPFRTVAAHLMKLPGRLFRDWRFVGGWEVLFERVTN